VRAPVRSDRATGIGRDGAICGKDGADAGDCAKIVATAEAEAARNHLAGVVAVADEGGWPIPTERMDHAAYLASVELAPGKARTAALFKKPSQALEDAINRGRLAAATVQGFTEMQGGLPIVVDGEVIGAVGASFDTPQHDVQVAQAGLAAVPH
jgi:glc operon protein GlcG